MCGIAGAIGPTADATSIGLMIQRMQHRGPDDRGVFSSPGIALGMCRLAIQDLSPAGHQPMTSGDGRYTSVFNGEIYNVRELRDALMREGASFRGTSDTEVVVEGFARWGRDVVGRLRGMWALAIFDNQRHELFLARDPFGIKPLYVYDDGKTRALSSEIKGLLAFPSVSRELDVQTIQNILLLGYPLAPRTILRHARALLPGEEVTIKLADGTTASRVVTLSYDAARAKHPPSDEEVRAALTDSVKQHLVSDVPVGLFFSGGIDSAVLALALRDIGANLTAYHAAMDGRPDTPYARRIAASLGIRLVEVPFAPADALRLQKKFFDAMDQPLADTGFLPTMLLAERAVQDVKVVLAGEGGDELFAGYDRAARWLDTPAHFSSRHQKSAGGVSQTLLARYPSLIRALPHVQGLVRRMAVRRGDAVGSFIAETSIALGMIDSATVRAMISSRLAARELPDGPLAPDRLIYLPDDLLAKADVATMSQSLEARTPFLDRNVFDLVAASSIAWKRAGGQSKAPLRRLLEAGGISRDLIDRPKAGFSVPLGDYLIRGQQDAIRAAATWYLDSYSGLTPAFDGILRWGLSRRNQFDIVSNRLGYSLYALLAFQNFSDRARMQK